MEYNQKDYNALKIELNKKLLLFGLIMAIYIAGCSALFSMRLQFACMSFTFIVGSVIIFFAYIYLVPPLKYRKFLREMNSGQQRENIGDFMRIEEDQAIREGLPFYPFITIDEEGFEHRYYWDAQKPLLQIEPGTKVKITTYGQSIKRLEYL
ncbi:MAG: hypothetical protein ACOX8S_09655 [Christensenellales bacterium]|jgi:hypothetical protein